MSPVSVVRMSPGVLAAGALALTVIAGGSGAAVGQLVAGGPESSSVSPKEVMAAFDAEELTAATREALSGQPGAPGSAWITGRGKPEGNEARAGDWFLDEENLDIYLREAGGWRKVVNIRGAVGADGTNGTNGTNGADGADGAEGPAGPAGVQGVKGDSGADAQSGRATKWLSGAGLPAAALGEVGDWYLDTASGGAHEKTAASSWSLVVNLRGVAGQHGLPGVDGADGADGLDGAEGLDGATWHVGQSPSPLQGTDGDLHLNVSTFDVSRKSAGAWAVVTNIRGQAGAAGATGAAGPAGAVGRTGATGDVGPTGPAGPVGALGPKGDKGDPGTAFGATYYNGAARGGTLVAVILGGTEIPFVSFVDAQGMTPRLSGTGVTVDESGLYRVAYQVQTTADLLVSARLTINGAAGEEPLRGERSTTTKAHRGEAIVALSAGDVLAVQLYGLSGAATLESPTTLTIHRVG